MSKHPEHTIHHHELDPAQLSEYSYSHFYDSKGYPQYDDDDPMPFSWTFKNGEGHRPQFEDRILNRIDTVRLKERQQRGEYDRKREAEEAATREEAASLRGFRHSAHGVGVAEGEKLQARHARSTGWKDVPGWHAPRTPEDSE